MKVEDKFQQYVDFLHKKAIKQLERNYAIARQSVRVLHLDARYVKQSQKLLYNNHPGTRIGVLAALHGIEGFVAADIVENADGSISLFVKSTYTNKFLILEFITDISSLCLKVLPAQITVRFFLHECVHSLEGFERMKKDIEKILNWESSLDFLHEEMMRPFLGMKIDISKAVIFNKYQA